MTRCVRMPQKQVGFSRLAPRMTMLRTIKLFALADTLRTPGFREMKMEDIPVVHALLKTYHSRHLLRVDFSEEDLAHWILPIDKVTQDEQNRHMQQVPRKHLSLRFVRRKSIPSPPVNPFPLPAVLRPASKQTHIRLCTRTS